MRCWTLELYLYYGSGYPNLVIIVSHAPRGPSLCSLTVKIKLFSFQNLTASEAIKKRNILKLTWNKNKTVEKMRFFFCKTPFKPHSFFFLIYVSISLYLSISVYLFICLSIYLSAVYLPKCFCPSQICWRIPRVRNSGTAHVISKILIFLSA